MEKYIYPQGFIGRGQCLRGDDDPAKPRSLDMKLAPGHPPANLLQSHQLSKMAVSDFHLSILPTHY